MIAEIEYYKGDILLQGKMIRFQEFKEQMNVTESIYDEQTDNFIALLCRRYDYSLTDKNLIPLYVYDRDTKKAYTVT